MPGESQWQFGAFNNEVISKLAQNAQRDVLQWRRKRIELYEHTAKYVFKANANISKRILMLVLKLPLRAVLSNEHLKQGSALTKMYPPSLTNWYAAVYFCSNFLCIVKIV